MTLRFAIPVFLLVLLTGCVVRVPAAGERMAVVSIGASAATEVDWPARVSYDPDGDSAIESAEPLFLPIGPYDRGYLYAFDSFTPTEPNIIGLLFVSQLPDEGWSLRRPPLTFTVTPRGGEPHSLRFPRTVSGTFLALWTPQDILEAPSARQLPRGLIVHLGSLGGVSGPERALIDRLVERGWAVLAVTPSGELLSTDVFTYAGVRSSIDGIANSIARTLDNSFAERAYAVRAGLEYIREHRPDLPLTPLVLVGGSIGAVHLPTVARALDAPPDAAVLIGGGADFLRVLYNSPLGRNRIKVSWIEIKPMADGDEPVFYASDGSDEDMHLLFDPVLERSKLDPFHTAECLACVPVLQLHARFDAIVPARFGDLLHERLGRPERWTYSTGHLGLFFALRFEANRIVEWIEQAVE